MKTQIITDEQEKKFKPITVQITAETIEDARLLFHLFNHSCLGGLIRKDPEYGFEAASYSTDMADMVFEQGVDDYILDNIESQGFEV